MPEEMTGQEIYKESIAREKIEKKPERYSQFYNLVANLSTKAIEEVLKGRSAKEILEDKSFEDIIEGEGDKAIQKVAWKKIKEGLENYQEVRDSVEDYKKEKEGKVDIKEIINNIQEKENFQFSPNEIQAQFVEGGMQLHFKNHAKLRELLGTEMKDPSGKMIPKPKQIELYFSKLDSFGYLLDHKQLNKNFADKFLGSIIITCGNYPEKAVRHELMESIAEQFILEAQGSKQTAETPRMQILREGISDFAAKIEDGWQPNSLSANDLGIENFKKHLGFTEDINQQLEQILISAQIYIENATLKGEDTKKITGKLANLLRSTVVNPADFNKIVETLVGKDIYQGSIEAIKDTRGKLDEPRNILIHELAGREMHSQGTLQSGYKFTSHEGMEYGIKNMASSGSYGVVYQAERKNPVDGSIDTIYIKEAIAEVSEHALNKPWVGKSGSKIATYPGKSLYETIEIDFPRERHENLHNIINSINPNDADALRTCIDNYLNEQISDPLNPTSKISRAEYYRNEISKLKTSASMEALYAREVNARAPESVVKVYGTSIIHDQQERGDKVLILMDQAPGKLLEEAIGELSELNYPLKENEIKDMLIHFLRKMAGIHESKMAHCDIKPGNLFIKLKRTANGAIADQNGNPLDPLNKNSHLVVEDVGIIDLGNIVTEQKKLAGQGAGVGTPGFAPFELYIGQTGGEPASDVYSLGVLTTCLLRKENFPSVPLMNNKDPMQAERLIFSVNQQISKEFHNVLRKMLDLNPKNRFQNAGELLSILEESEEFIDIIESKDYIRYSPFKASFSAVDFMNSQDFMEALEYLKKNTELFNWPFRKKMNAFVKEDNNLLNYLGLRLNNSQDKVEFDRQTLNANIEILRNSIKRDESLDWKSRTLKTVHLKDKTGRYEYFYNTAGTTVISTNPNDPNAKPRTKNITGYELYKKKEYISEEETWRKLAEMSLIVMTYDVVNDFIKNNKLPLSIKNSANPLLNAMMGLLNL